LSSTEQIALAIAQPDPAEHPDDPDEDQRNPSIDPVHAVNRAEQRRGRDREPGPYR